MINNVKKNKKFYLVILLITIVQAVRYFPFKFGGYNQIMLSFTWAYGFIQRALIGTILDLESRLFHIPLKYMRYIYGVFTVAFFTLLFYYILYATLNKKKTADAQQFFKGLALAFFIGPGWVANYANFALTDIWLAMCSVLSVYLIFKEKCVWVTVVISIIGVLIHPGYVFLYFNLVLAAIFYKTFMQVDKMQKKSFVLLGVQFVLTSFLFLYMFLFSHTKAGITVDYVMSRTAEFVSKSVEEISNHQSSIEGFLFRKEGMDQGIHFCIEEYRYILVAMGIVFLPFFIEIFNYWKLVVNNAKTSMGNKCWMYGILPFGCLTLVPVYLMQNDYGRWTFAGFFYEFVMIWILNLIEDKNVVRATSTYMTKVRENKAYYIFLLCYAAICGTFEQNLVNNLVSTIETYIWKVVELLK